MSFNYLQSYVKMPVSTRCYIPTSLPKNHHQYCTLLCSIQALDTKRPVGSLVKGGLLGQNSFADYKTKYFGRRYKSTKSTYFR